MTKEQILNKVKEYYEKEIKRWGDIMTSSMSLYKEQHDIVETEFNKCVFVLDNLLSSETEEEIDDFLNDFEGLVKEAVEDKKYLIYEKLDTAGKVKYISSLYQFLQKELIDLQFYMYEYESDNNTGCIEYQLAKLEQQRVADSIEFLEKRVNSYSDIDAFLVYFPEYNSYRL